MKTFVTSDTHFGHVNIIKYCNRPFETVIQMNEAIIERWNARVGLDDTVYFLGDLAMGPKVDASFIAAMLLRLNGQKTIILGNHDQPSKWGPGLRAVVFDYQIEDVQVLDDQIHTARIDGKDFVMCHFPMEDWDGKHHGSIHLHGHSHTSNLLDLEASGGPPDPTNPDDTLIRALNGGIKNRYDIGVDMYGGPVQITGDLRYLNDPKGWA